MVYSNGYIMSGDREVVRIESGEVISIEKKFAPLHLITRILPLGLKAEPLILIVLIQDF